MSPRLIPTLALLGVLATSASAWAVDDTTCAMCHAQNHFTMKAPDGSTRDLHVTPETLAGSPHAAFGCTTCHTGIDSIPHDMDLAKVQCTTCHNASSSMGPQGVDYEAYEHSVHGQLVAQGVSAAPSCQDCHGNHAIRGKDDASSAINHANVAKTCGACHSTEYAEWSESVHGRGVQSGEAPEAATCTDCHGEHGITRSSEDTSSTNPTHVAETCGQCHGALPLMQKYGVETETVETFQESFHGVANHFGDTTVANCASCHGSHDILGPDDPKSSVNPANIPATCGKCHEGANANYANGRMHVSEHEKSSGVIYWVALFFKWLTISSMVGLIAHTLLDLAYQLRTSGKRDDAHRS